MADVRPVRQLLVDYPPQATDYLGGLLPREAISRLARTHALRDGRDHVVYKTVVLHVIEDAADVDDILV